MLPRLHVVIDSSERGCYIIWLGYCISPDHEFYRQRLYQITTWTQIMHSEAASQNPNVAKFTKLRQNVVKKEIRHKDVTINAMLTRTPCYLATLSFGHQNIITWLIQIISTCTTPGHE